VIALEQLASAASAAGISLDETQLSMFATYCDLLDQRGRTARLTGVRGWDRVRDELLLRSLRIVAGLADSQRQELLADGRRVLDVGAGAGIPGIVLKVALPGLRLTLLEPGGKKTDFLRDAVSALALDDVEVVRGRAEEVAHDPRHRASYDVVTARAVAALPELAELTLPFCRVGGTVIALKGPHVEAEVASAEYAAGLLGAGPAEVRIAGLPGPAAPDSLVLWRKETPTPAEYPRRNGVPHQRPLGAPGAAVSRRRPRL
jgi:16S rRNA (guanine527-N7)-methyltransferase